MLGENNLGQCKSGPFSACRQAEELGPIVEASLNARDCGILLYTQCSRKRRNNRAYDADADIKHRVPNRAGCLLLRITTLYSYHWSNPFVLSSDLWVCILSTSEFLGPDEAMLTRCLTQVGVSPSPAVGNAPRDQLTSLLDDHPSLAQSKYTAKYRRRKSFLRVPFFRH